MKCPNCNETLLMTERNRVEIDYCPICRGVWLDKGELDKLMQIASEQNGDPAPYRKDEDRRDFGSRDYNERSDRNYDDRSRHSQHQHPRKKKSFLSDFFDFD